MLGVMSLHITVDRIYDERLQIKLVNVTALYGARLMPMHVSNAINAQQSLVKHAFKPLQIYCE